MVRAQIWIFHRTISNPYEFTQIDVRRICDKLPFCFCVGFCFDSILGCERQFIVRDAIEEEKKSIPNNRWTLTSMVREKRTARINETSAYCMF